MAINHKKKKRQTKKSGKQQSPAASDDSNTTMDQLVTDFITTVDLAATASSTAVDQPDADSSSIADLPVTAPRAFKGFEGFDSPKDHPMWKKMFEEEGPDGLTNAERGYAKVLESRAKYGAIGDAYTTSREIADIIKLGPIEGVVTQDELDFFEMYFELAFGKKIEDADDEPVGPDPTKPWWWACVHDEYYRDDPKGHFTDERQAEIAAKTSRMDARGFMEGWDVFLRR